jgi:hypothetical protein
MPKIVITHAVKRIETWLKGEEKCAAVIAR